MASYQLQANRYLCKPVQLEKFAIRLGRNDHFVARALGGIADVVSVNVIDEARRASTAGHFDLAVLDIALAAPCNINSTPDIRDSSGNAIPLVAFYAQKSESAYDGPANIALTTSHASIEGLMVAVKEHLVSRLPIVPEQLK